MEKDYLKCIMVFLSAFCLFLLTGIMIAEKASIMAGVCFVLSILFTLYGIIFYKHLKKSKVPQQKQRV